VTIEDKNAILCFSIMRGRVPSRSFGRPYVDLGLALDRARKAVARGWYTCCTWTTRRGFPACSARIVTGRRIAKSRRSSSYRYSVDDRSGSNATTKKWGSRVEAGRLRSRTATGSWWTPNWSSIAPAERDAARQRQGGTLVTNDGGGCRQRL
jgi:hypothetical protein